MHRHRLRALPPRHKRPQLAHTALEQRIIYGKRQARPATFTARHERNRAQRVVKVGRMHLRALLRRACSQPRSRRVHATAPCSYECAVRGAVLQPDSIEAIVQSAGLHSTSAQTAACGSVINAM